jgi:hypothetical protein
MMSSNLSRNAAGRRYVSLEESTSSAPLSHPSHPPCASHSLRNAQTHRPMSAAVQTHQGLGTYQRSAYKDLVAEAVEQINHDRKQNGAHVLAGSVLVRRLCFVTVCSVCAFIFFAQSGLASLTSLSICDPLVVKSVSRVINGVRAYRKRWRTEVQGTV